MSSSKFSSNLIIPIIIIATTIIVVVGFLVFYSGNNENQSINNILTIKDNDHYLGNKNAKVSLIVYSDFQCPACGYLATTLRKIATDFSDKIVLIYRHFPLKQHLDAFKAAEASEIAASQNKFWEMHDLLFENQKNMAESNLNDYSVTLGLNTQNFINDLKSEKYKDRVDENYQEGVQLNIQGTPSLYINQKEYTQLKFNESDYNNLKLKIEDLLK